MQAHAAAMIIHPAYTKPWPGEAVGLLGELALCGESVIAGEPVIADEPDISGEPDSCGEQACPALGREAAPIQSTRFFSQT